MKLLWTKQIPEKEGWYWIQYEGKRGRIVCPASVTYIGKVYIVHTTRNDMFNQANIKEFGWFRFGPEIKLPNLSLRAKAE